MMASKETKLNNETKEKNNDEQERMLPQISFEEELNEFFKEMPVTKETSCGFWIFKGPRLQRLANKKAFVVIYGLCGLMYSSTFSYFTGTISTMEKRFKTSSKNMGIISVGNDVTQLLGSALLSYYAGKGHRPRWIALGMYSVGVFCFMNAIPHLLYGPGEDALQLTFEYGDDYNLNMTVNATDQLQNKHLCNSDGNGECDLSEGSIVPMIIWFVSQLIGGIGGSLYFSLGYSYMDDNIKKSKSPVILGFTYFIRMMGPAMGYSLVSIFLKLYIVPQLTPTITNSDPRWIGAWWMGWLVQGVILLVLATLLAALPKELPRSAARKELIRQKSKEAKEDHIKPSFADLKQALKRLMSNQLYVFAQISGICFIFGYSPYWVFMPKYIEIQFRQSASVSSLVTGTIGLVFSALGVLTSGVYLQIYKPGAKFMAFWNTVIALIVLLGTTTYTFLGCSAVDDQIPVFLNRNTNMTCSEGCRCDFVKFSPVCSPTTQETFISACHAGCTQQDKIGNGTLIFSNCACIEDSEHRFSLPSMLDDPTAEELISRGGSAISGPCAVDCQYSFYIFLGIVCLLKLSGAMARVTNFLVSVRCVESRDKVLSLGIGMTLLSIFAFIPAPIFFGHIMDTTCLVWGKTCTQKGNCWFYNARLLRHKLNLYAAVFFFAGLVFDILIWWKIDKNLDMFGDGLEKIQNEKMAAEEEKTLQIIQDQRGKEIYENSEEKDIIANHQDRKNVENHQDESEMCDTILKKS